MGKRSLPQRRGKALSLWANAADTARAQRLRKKTGLTFSHIVRVLTTQYEEGKIIAEGLPKIGIAARSGVQPLT